MKIIDLFRFECYSNIIDIWLVATNKVEFLYMFQPSFMGLVEYSDEDDEEDEEEKGE